AVLGHEIAHVTARHGAHRHTQGVGTSVAAGVLSAVLGNRAANQIIELGWRAWLSKYNRTQEYEADKLGVETLYRAGYDAHGAADFLAAMGAYSELTAQLRGNSATVPGWFATHPNTDDRVDKAEALAEQLQPNDKADISVSIGRAPYLAAIDGMRYTEIPTKKGEQAKPLKIKIIEVQPQDTVASLVARMQVSALPEQHFRILNNYMPDDKVRPGQKVKLVVAD
ncbi:MAG: M48 family metalloprotease, partial [Alphaproteobacteria bacterium]|nr:M48 family metalloprotease [Alphaproteobacteria bacterium]